MLAKKIKELVDDKYSLPTGRHEMTSRTSSHGLDCSSVQNGYPPEWDEEVFEKVMEQAENFKKYEDE